MAELGLEQSLEGLGNSSMQKDIATALSATVKSTKRQYKGLLSRTEAAVDDSQTLLDQGRDVNDVLGQLSLGETFDDDDLMAELQEMMADRDNGLTWSPWFRLIAEGDLLSRAERRSSFNRRCVLLAFSSRFSPSKAFIFPLTSSNSRPIASLSMETVCNSLLNLAILLPGW